MLKQLKIILRVRDVATMALRKKDQKNMMNISFAHQCKIVLFVKLS